MKDDPFAKLEEAKHNAGKALVVVSMITNGLTPPEDAVEHAAMAVAMLSMASGRIATWIADLEHGTGRLELETPS